MTVIYLHGSLADQFGERFDLAVSSAAEAVRALIIQLPGFRQVIRNGHWHVIRDAGVVRNSLDVEQLHLGLGKADLHIVPAIEGAGGDGRGIGKVVAGVALAAGAFFFAPAAGMAAPLLSIGGNAVLTYGSIAHLGLGLALTGLPQMLSPAPNSLNGKETVDRRESFLFQGAQNVTAQGGAVPVGYGRFRVGSVVISAGLEAEQI